MFDKGIPVPGARTFAGRNSHKSKYPFITMEIGDSVFYPDDAPSIVKSKPYLYAATIYKRYGTPRFAGRMVTEAGIRGVRIWRIE